MIKTMGQRLSPTRLARSPGCLLMPLVDSKQGSSSGPSHSRPSDMNPHRSAAGGAEKHACAPALYFGASSDPVWLSCASHLARIASQYRLLCFDIDGQTALACNQTGRQPDHGP